MTYFLKQFFSFCSEDPLPEPVVNRYNLYTAPPIDINMDFPVRKFYFSESEDFKAMDSSSHTDSNKEISATKIELMNAAKIKKKREYFSEQYGEKD